MLKRKIFYALLFILTGSNAMASQIAHQSLNVVITGSDIIFVGKMGKKEIKDERFHKNLGAEVAKT